MESTAERLVRIARGTKTGAIVAAVHGLDRTIWPRFEGVASTTSDGYVLCDFVDADGVGHYSAFVGERSEVIEQVKALARHAKLTPAERAGLELRVENWCGKQNYWRQ
jgi:hypothetical protein